MVGGCFVLFCFSVKHKAPRVMVFWKEKNKVLPRVSQTPDIAETAATLAGEDRSWEGKQKHHLPRGRIPAVSHLSSVCSQKSLWSWLTVPKPLSFETQSFIHSFIHSIVCPKTVYVPGTLLGTGSAGVHAQAETPVASCSSDPLNVPTLPRVYPALSFGSELPTYFTPPIHSLRPGCCPFAEDTQHCISTPIIVLQSVPPNGATAELHQHRHNSTRLNWVFPLKRRHEPSSRARSLSSFPTLMWHLRGLWFIGRTPSSVPVEHHGSCTSRDPALLSDPRFVFILTEVFLSGFPV